MRGFLQEAAHRDANALCVDSELLYGTETDDDETDEEAEVEGIEDQ
jgi:hypothetical protein